MIGHDPSTLRTDILKRGNSVTIVPVIFHPEEGLIKFHPNVGTFLPECTAWYPEDRNVHYSE
jgi:hypothetical protein